MGRRKYFGYRGDDLPSMLLTRLVEKRHNPVEYQSCQVRCFFFFFDARRPTTRIFKTYTRTTTAWGGGNNNLIIVQEGKNK